MRLGRWNAAGRDGAVTKTMHANLLRHTLVRR
jgi:hypothetical protein